MTRSRDDWGSHLRAEWWWLSYLFVFVVTFAFFLALQASPIFADPDSFYHAKMAILIRDQGAIHDFSWLGLTVLGAQYTDQHFLYHVALIPFVTWLPPLIGIKLATVFFGALLATVVYWLMRQHGVRWALAFVLILVLTRPFAFRISLAKAPSTSLVFLFIGLGWAWQYHLRRLFGLAFTYVWYYGGFPLLTVGTAIYAGVSTLHNRFISRINPHRWTQKILALVSRHSRTHRVKRLNLRLIMTVIGGTLAGLVINPYFPVNFPFYSHQLISIGVINFRDVIGVGGEWYPYGFNDLVGNTALTSLVVLLALAGVLVRFRAQTKQALTLGLLAAFFFVLTLKSRRYVEYYVPTALLFAAYSLTDTLKGRFGHLVGSELYYFWRQRWWGRALISFVVTLGLVGLGYLGGRDAYGNWQDLRQGFRASQYVAAANWLANHTPAGSRVVHSDWDEFPLLFYHNSHNTYIAGLDPTFLYQADHQRYWTWVDITLGKYRGDLYEAVTMKLASAYVFIAGDHQGMEDLVRQDGRFILRYRDDEAAIYEAVHKSS
ncbi:MAG: hypothetical protein HYY50_05370 [Candidatus Kerfeldbacteria bacterium]|nr:hypothetical protein [Candidatus Kerfeldbacteria bacterium]